MKSSPVGGSIHLAARPEAELRPGDTVTLSVIKQLDAGKWAVGIQGRVYPASSRLPLQPGDVLRARVGVADGGLVLIISETVPDAVQTVLNAQGMRPGGVEEVIARALARAGLPMDAEAIQGVKRLASRAPQMQKSKAARIGAALIDRGIPPEGPAARELLPVLGFGGKGGGDPRRFRRQPLPDSPKAVKEYFRGLPVQPARASGALQAFNHVPARSQDWIVIPFHFAMGSEDLAGTMKILYDRVHERPIALTLSTEGINFHLPLLGKRTLGIYCDGEAMKRAAASRLDGLRRELNNMGLEVDDTIKDGETFDGFTPVGERESIPSVDTLG